MARNLFATSFFACLAFTLASPAINGRIAGGYEVRNNQFPYQVAIRADVPGDNVVPLQDDFCSGSLISENYVLTAASCVVKAEKVTIIIGGPNIEDIKPDQVVTVSSEFIIPEDYDSSMGAAYRWDIALIKLSEPVELSENIQVVELAEGDDDYAGDIGTVAGWGATYAAQFTVEPVLRWIETVILSYRQCIKDNPWYKQVVVEGSNICQFSETNKSACRGDTGAPLVVDGVQVGLIAYTPANCFRGLPVIFTRVGNYIDWIKENSDL